MSVWDGRPATTIPDEPTEELIKEVYARFGLAYYHSECLHRGLCIIHAIASFKGPEGITRPRVEEKLAYAYSLTLGQVKDELKALIPDELFRRLDEAVAKRNFLAHHFWFERCHLMFRATRLRQMIEELDEYSDLFRRFDRMAEEYVLPKMKELGIDGEEFQRCLQEVISGEPMEPFPTKRKLRKRGRVVRVWEFAIADEGKPLIFETDDGCFWQLSDVGLGWTYYDRVKPDC